MNSADVTCPPIQSFLSSPAMSARASRRAAQFDFSSLSSVECLLVAQAAYEYGAAQSSWSAASKLLAKHALVSRPKNFFTPTLCSSIYEHMMKDAGLERTDAAGAPKAPENLVLAQKHFKSRFEELVGLIKSEEAKFKHVMNEIDEIKAGRWDSNLKTRSSGTPTSAGEGSGADAAATEDDADADAVSAADSHPDETDASQDEEENYNEATQGEEEEVESDQEQDGDAGMQEIEDESQSDANKSESGETISSKPASEEAGGQGESSEDEPLQVVRRSTRRKSSAASTAPPPSARPRGRRQRPVKEERGSTAGSDVDDGGEPAEQSGEVEEESPSYPGAPRTRDGKRKAAFLDDRRDAKRAREDSELPEEMETTSTRVPLLHGTNILTSPLTRDSDTATRTVAGRKGSYKLGAPSSSASASIGIIPAPTHTPMTEGLPNKRFQNVIGLLHQQISTHRNGTIFHHPIKPSDAPDYYEIVKRPMDLKTIKQRVKDGAISNSLEFQRDVYLMFANAMVYNRPGSDVYTMAEDVRVSPLLPPSCSI
ncbi:hypothetical protein NMY22_g7816 [Coprinellus aureogranulatus]|nr:hypothetical protein NMY22_g7816 [Coprinellus aureogranulatus]